MASMTDSNRLAMRMLLAMIAGIAAGLGFMALRENLGADSSTWMTINNLLFQDISQQGAHQPIGLFYIGGQLFIRALQLIIVPVVFSSIVLAIGEIKEASTLGRISVKTISWFFLTTFAAMILASLIGFACYDAGFFNITIEGIKASAGKSGTNPLLVLLNIIPANIFAVLSVNNSVLAVVFVAVLTGLCLNKLGLGTESVVWRLCNEISQIIVCFLNFVVVKFGPFAIFMLLSRTFATYGIAYLKPAFAYVGVCVASLLFYLFIGYPFILYLGTRLNPVIFVKKIFKVIVFGFSTSSSAATLPLNLKTNIEELGVNNQTASFVLPLGMTVNMDGTAIMQVIATLFIAGCAGFEVGALQLVVIMLLALIASVGTPAAPGAGAVILFTILSGAGFTTEPALVAYSLILAINRPIEMLVTSINCVGDSVVAIAVAKSEGKLDKDIYNQVD